MQPSKRRATYPRNSESARAAQRAAEIALDSKVGDQHTIVAEALAELAEAKYKLEHTTVRAPSDGYVSNLQLYPGAFVRLKQPVMTFINSEEHWLLATVPQRGIQRLHPGDKAQVAFEMYPGKLFDAEIENVVWAAGDAQGIPSGMLPHAGQLRGAELFMVRLRMKAEEPDYPLRFGASGLVAMYSSDAAGFLVLLRQIELQSESFLNLPVQPVQIGSHDRLDPDRTGDKLAHPQLTMGSPGHLGDAAYYARLCLGWTGAR